MPENVNTTALASGQFGIDEGEDNRPVMIDVEHVSMSFNMASEQLNNLKEYAIAIARGKLFFEEFKALDDVSFQVRKGDVFGIMGTNGSGKSTILKIIAGVLEPTKGKCSVNGNIAPLIELGAGFDMDLSARENIYLNGALLGYSKDFIDEHFDEIVEFAEVEKFLDMPLKNYSSGMVSRIAFAIATVIVPEILVVDEVLSVGDFMFQKKCENRITQLIEEHGVTVLIVSHSNEQIARLCNKAIWIEKGHTRLIGDAKQVARIYGGLGGRVGDSVSEKCVFDALVRSIAEPYPDAFAEEIFGNDEFSLSSKLVSTAWNHENIGALALVADNTHVNAVVANPLASFYQAPVVPFQGNGELPGFVLRLLYQSKPSKIFVFSCGQECPEVMAQLRDFDWAPEIQQFGAQQELLDFSLSVYRYGFERKAWADELVFADFSNNLEAFAIAPTLYRFRIPVIMGRMGVDVAEDLESLQLSDVTGLILIGSWAEEMYRTNDFGFDGRAELLGGVKCASLDSALTSKLQSNTKTTGLAVANKSIALWQQQISIGCYCGRTDNALLLLDQSNLDNLAESIRYIRNNKSNFKTISFVGRSEDFDNATKAMLLQQLI